MEPQPLFQFYNPTQYTPDPQYGARGYQPLGYYDINPFHGMDQQLSRGAAQTTGEQIWNGLISRGASIAPKMGAGLGSVIGAFEAIGTGEVDRIWNNNITEYFNKQDEALKEAYPVYKTRAYAESGLLGKLATTSFWADEGFDMLAYAGSAYLQGAAVLKVGSLMGSGLKALEAGKAISEGSKASKYITQGLQALNAEGVGQKAGLIATTAYNTIAEAGAEAYQTQKDIENYYLARNLELPPDKRLTPEQIKQASSQAAAETFWWNVATLAVPNFIQNQFFHGSWDSKTKSLYDSVWNSPSGKEAAKQLSTKWKEAGLGFLSEGSEENIQTSIQQYEKAYAQGLTDYGMAAEIGRNMASGIVGLGKGLVGMQLTPNETESAVSIFLGGLLGGTTGFISGARDDRNNKKYLEDETKRKSNLFDTYGRAAETIFTDNVGSIYKSSLEEKEVTDENGNVTKVTVPKFETDDSGAPIKNPMSMMAGVLNAARNKTMIDLEALAAANNDPLMAEHHKIMSLAIAAQDLVSKGYTEEEIAKYFEQQKTIGTEEAKSLGVETFISENLDIAKGFAKEFIKIAKQNASSKSESVEQQRADSVLAKTEYMLHAKKHSLQNLLQKDNLPDKTKESLTQMLEDVNSFQQEIVNNRESLRQEYVDQIYPKFRKMAKAAELVQKKSRTAEETIELNDTLLEVAEDEFINGRYSQEDASFNWATHLSPKTLTKLRPGIKDEELFEKGSQMFVEELLEDSIDNKPTDSLQSQIGVFTERVHHRTPRAEMIQAKLLGKLEAERTAIDLEIAPLRERTDRIEAVLNNEDIFSEDDLEVAIEDAGLNEDDAAVVRSLFNPDYTVSLAEITRAIIQQQTPGMTAEQADNFLNSLAARSVQNKDLKIALESKSLDEKDKARTTLQQERAKEWGLEREFLNTQILDSALDAIAKAFAHPEEVTSQIRAHLENLRMARKLWKDRDAATIKKIDDAIHEFEKDDGILYLLAKNEENREAKQIATNNTIVENIASALGLIDSQMSFEPEQLGLLNEIGANTSNENIKKIVVDIVGEDKFKAAYNAIFKSNNYEALVTFVHYIFTQASKEQRELLTAELLETKEKLSKIFGSVVDSNKTLTQGDYSGSKQNIISTGLLVPFRYLFGNDFVDDPNSIIFKWTLTRDSAQLYNELDKANIPEKLRIAAKQLILLERKILDIHSLIFLGKEDSLVAKQETFFGDTTPTLQQSIVLDSLLNFFAANSNTDLHGNWALVEGLPGTGKSFVVANLFIRLLEKHFKVSRESVVAFSGNPITSKNINNAIFGTTSPNTTLQSFLGSDLSNVKVVVIDEVFTLTNNELRDIAKKLEGTNIKVITLGDPSQMTVEEDPLIRSPLSHITKTTPLTATYRTNVGAISTFVDNFKLRTAPVMTAFAEANVTTEQLVQEGSGKASGVLIGNFNSLVQILSKPSSRKRVVIVNSTTAVEQFKRDSGLQESDTLQILPINKVQGAQWDEVYTILTDNVASTPLDVNRAYYTAFSRAKQFLFVVSDVYQNGKTSNSLESRIEEATEQVERNKERIKDILEDAKKLQTVLNGGVVVPENISPVEKIDIADENETVFDHTIEPVTEDPQTATVQEPTVEYEFKEGDHRLHFPQNHVLISKKSSVTEEGRIIQMQKNGKSFFVVVAKTTGGKWVQVGVLGNRDFENNDALQQLVNESTAKKMEWEHRLSNTEGFDIPNIDAVTVSKVSVPHTSKLQSLWLDDYTFGPTVIEDTLKRFIKSYFNESLGIYPAGVVSYTDGLIDRNTDGTPKMNMKNHWLNSDGSINWKVVKEHATIQILSRKDIAAQNRPDLTLVSGIPYLIISDISQSGTTESKSDKKFYIPLDAMPITQDSHIIKTIRELRDTLRAMSQIHPAFDFNARIGQENDFLERTREFARANFDTVESNTNKSSTRELVPKSTRVSSRQLFPELGNIDYDTLDNLLLTLVPLTFHAKLHLVYDNTREEAEKRAEALGDQIVGIEQKGNRFYLLENTGTDKKSFYREWKISSDGGEAQIALNALAQANEFIVPGANLSRIRMTRENVNFKGQATRLHTAHSVLSNRTYIHYNSAKKFFTAEYGVSFTDTVDTFEHFINHIVKHSGGRLTRDEVVDIINQRFVTPPFDFVSLDAIVDNFNSDGTHRTLRTPLRMSPKYDGDTLSINYLGKDLSNKTNRDLLAKSVRTIFGGVSNTEVVISIPTKVEKKKEAPVSEPTPSDRVVPLRDEIDNIKISPDLVSFIKTLNLDHISIVFSPSVTNVWRTQFTENGVHIYVSHSIDLKNNRDQTILLHEILHAIGNAAIHKTLIGTATEAEKLFTERIRHLYAIAKKKAGGFDKLVSKLETTLPYEESNEYTSLTEFIASLSNSATRNWLKKINLLNKIFEAIAELLRGLGIVDANVYDAAVTALKDLYATPEMNTSQGEYQTLLEKFNATPLRDLNQGVVISYVEDGLLDPDTGKLTEVFDSFDEATKVEFLKSLLGLDIDYSTPTPMDTSAVYKAPKTSNRATPGLLFTTLGMQNMVETLLPDISDKRVLNLITTILNKVIEDPTSDVVNNILQMTQVQAAAYFWDNFVTSVDKFRIEVQYKVKGDDAVKMFADPTTDLGEMLSHALSILRNRKSELEVVISDVELSSVARYNIARSFLMNRLEEGMNPKGSETLVKTKDEVLKETIADLKSRSGYLSALRIRLRALQNQFATSDRVGQIRLRPIITAMREEVISLTSLITPNDRTGTSDLFFDLYKDLYPKSSYKEGSDLELSNESEQMSRKDREDRESKGIQDHIKDYSTSQELTLSETIKDFLTLMKFTKDGKTMWLNSGYAYLKMLQKAQELNLLDLQQSIEILAKSGGSVEDIAINTRLHDLLKQVSSSISNNLWEYPKDVAIVPKLNKDGRMVYVAVYNPLKDLRNITSESIPTGSVESSEFVTTSDLYEFLKKYSPSLTVSNFNDLFQKGIALNQYKEIYNVFGSMVENNLLIGQRTSVKGLEVMNFVAKSSGITFKLKEEIKAKLELEYMNDTLRAMASNFAASFPVSNGIIRKGGAANLEQKQTAFREFVLFLGLSDLANDVYVPSDSIVDALESIRFVLDKIENLQTLSADLSDEVETEATNTFTAFVKDIDGKINIFANLIETSVDVTRNPSVRDPKGQKYYKFHEGTWAKDVIHAITQSNPRKNVAVSFLGTGGASKHVELPEHLSADTYNHNIFKTGLGILYQQFEHGGLLSKDTGSAQLFQRETAFFWNHREFVQGFLSTFQQSGASTVPKFTLYSYPPSDKPKCPAFKIKILSGKSTTKDGVTKESEIRQALRATIKYFIEKKDVRFDIVNYNKSQEEDLYRNFTILQTVDKALGGLNDSNIDEAVNLAMNELSQISRAVAARMVELQVTFPAAMNSIMYGSEMMNLYDNTGLLTQEEFEVLRERQQTVAVQQKKGEVDSFRSKFDGKYIVKIEDILPIVDLWVKNHYISSFHLHQLFLGDQASFKDSGDVVKRMAGPYAPGIKGVVNEVGMPSTFRVLVVKDLEAAKDLESIDSKKANSVDYTKGSFKERLKNVIFGNRSLTDAEVDQFEMFIAMFPDLYKDTDAQGFMHPDRYKELSKGFGVSWGMGNVMKPVHFQLVKHTFTRPDGTTYTAAIPVYLKYSTVVLTDDLVSRFPMLGVIRQKLEVSKAGEMLMTSGIKTGYPSKGLVDANTLLTASPEELEISTITLDSKHYRFQNNPATSPQKEVSLFTQLLYFINVFENTHLQADKVYAAIAELIKMGKQDFFDKIGFDGQRVDTAKLRSFLAKKFEGPGSERALDLLLNGVSLDNPLLMKKAIIALASGLDSEAIRVKFGNGGKWVLQTASYIEKYKDVQLFGKEDSSNLDRSLAYTRKEVTIDGKTRAIINAEVIVPMSSLTPEQLEAVKAKKDLYLLGDALGYRIPTSELHSAITLKVVGVYDDNGTNVIIAPRELVVIQGSDFDVDSLFVVMRELFSNKDVNVVRADTFKRYAEVLETARTALLESQSDLTEEGFNKLAEFQETLLTTSRLLATASKFHKELSSEESVEAEKLFQVFIAKNSTVQNSKLRNKFKEETGLYRRGNAWYSEDDVKADITFFKSKLEALENDPSLVKAGPGIKAWMAAMKTPLSQFKEEQTSIGSVNSPIGYKSSPNGYVLDDDFIDSINAEIEELTRLLNAYKNSDISSNIVSKLEASIKQFRTIKQRHLKNIVIENVMTIISDPAMYERTMFAISLDPLRKAYDELPESAKIDKSTRDLSNPLDKYSAFKSLTDGGILTGAFANAVKVFAYLIRAGKYDGNSGSNSEEADNEHNLQGVYDKIAEYTMLKKMPILEIELVPTELQEEFKTLPREEFNKHLLSRIKSLQAVRRRIAETVPLNTSVPMINPLYHISIGNKKYDGLSRFDAAYRNRKSQRVTVTFDALLNAAIDNLKEQMLPLINVNTNTGSAMVGMIAMGISPEQAVQVLTHPFLSMLSSGEVWKVEKFISSTLEEQQSNWQHFMSESITDEELQRHDTSHKSEHAVFNIFYKAWKVGEDIRNLASYLDIIRGLDVFIEDIDGTVADLNNKIGVIVEENGVMRLRPKADFSIVALNLFEANPHVKAAQETFEDLNSLISTVFKTHSPEIRDIATGVATQTTFLQKGGEEQIENSAENKALIRMKLLEYLYATVVNEDALPSLDLTVDSSGVLKSPQRLFSESVARKIHILQKYHKDHKIDNRFLRLTTVYTDWETKTVKIKFTGGNNMNATDVQRILSDFKALNRFEIVGDEVQEKLVSAGHISSLQKDIGFYAVLNYGLNFSTSNFSNYIHSTIIKDLDKGMLSKLDAIIKSKTQDQLDPSFVSQFTLGYVISQYDRIPSLIKKSIVKQDQSGRRSGFTLIKTEDVTYPVYFDLEVDLSEVKTSHPFVKLDWKNRATVYKLVAFGDSSAYYQEVGKISETLHTAPKQGYSISEHFNPEIRTIKYWDMGNNFVITSTNPEESYSVGDHVWISPNFDYTRQHRQYVKITNIESHSKLVQQKKKSYTIKGYKVTYEKATPPSKQVVESQVPTTYAVHNQDVAASKGTLTRNDSGRNVDSNGVEYQSVTQDIIPLLKNKAYDGKTLGQRVSDRMWKDKDPNERLLNTISSQKLNKQEYADQLDALSQRGVIKGSILHLIIDSVNDPSPAKDAELSRLMELGGFEDWEFKWLDVAAVRAIFYKTGANTYTRRYDASNERWEYDINPNATDKILTEIPVKMSRAGENIAGIIDLLIDHGDDYYSMFDIKSGANFDKEFEFDMFKFGDTATEDIFDTPRNRAKLQLMLYAILFKQQYPNATFNVIRPLHIRNQWSINRIDYQSEIRVGAYLEMISKYLKKEKPVLYESLSQIPGIWEPYTYQQRRNDILKDAKQPVSANLKILNLRLQDLVLRHERASKNDSLAESLERQIKDVTKQILELRNDKSYAAYDDDISMTSAYFASPGSSTNKYVQMYHKLLIEQKTAAREEYNYLIEIHNKLLRKLMVSMGKTPALRGFISGANGRELFDWMYVKDNEGNILRYKNDQVKSEVSNLSKEQIDYLKFTLDNIDRFFVDSMSEYKDPRTGKKVALANRIVTTKIVNGKQVELTNLDIARGGNSFLQKSPFTYYRGFIPKVAPTKQDVAEKYSIFSSEYWKHVWLRDFTYYFESTYSDAHKTEEVMPMKYLGNPDINASQNFSVNNEIIFNSFLRDYLNKEHLEEVAMFGKGIQYYLTAKEHEDENINYSNLINFFENSVNLHVLGNKAETLQPSQRRLRVNTSKGWKSFSWVKFIRSIKNYFSAATMWLKPISGIANFTFASLYNLKEGIRGSITGHGFTLLDLLDGYRMAIATIADKGIEAALGHDSLATDKLHILMKKLKLYNDSYDWYTSPNELLTSNNKIVTSNALYLFHSVPEEIISLSLYYAQMKSMKAPDGKSIWDHYVEVKKRDDFGNEYVDYEWDGTVRGVVATNAVSGAVEYKEVLGLTPEELAKMNYTYEKIHGGYKTEERVAAEYHIWGELMLQFKRYMPAILRNNFASKGERRTEGKYIIQGKDDQGRDILQWTPAIIEGRWITLIKVLTHYAGIKFGSNDSQANGVSKFFGLQTNENYSWDNLSEQQKEDMKDGMITAAMLLLLMFGYTRFWDRDEEDATKKLYKRVMDDVAGQWWFPEVAMNTLKLAKPVALEKGTKWIDSAAELSWSLITYPINPKEAMTQQGNLRGLKNFERLNVISSSYHDVFKFYEEDNTFFNERLK